MKYVNRSILIVLVISVQYVTNLFALDSVLAASPQCRNSQNQPVPCSTPQPQPRPNNNPQPTTRPTTSPNNNNPFQTRPNNYNNQPTPRPVNQTFVHTHWRGAGWHRNYGYQTPPGWGLSVFPLGLTIGAVLTAPPPYYSQVYVVGGNGTYIYSEGVFMENPVSSQEKSENIFVNKATGDPVSSLPEGCSNIYSNDVMEIKCNDALYEPLDKNNNPFYKVVQS